MATKSTKSAGSLIAGQSGSYWINAAKQFIWPIDFTDLQSLVPEKDLELAGQNLMVKHFTAHGWHIQSSIDVIYNKPYIAPESTGKPIFYVKPDNVQPESSYKIGAKYRIKSSDCELKITHIEKGKVHLEYTNRPHKAPLLSSEEQLGKVYWEEI